MEYAEAIESQRFDSLEEQGEMGTDWGNFAVSGLYLAADLAMIGETNSKEGGKKKYVKERKNKHKKKQTQEEDESMQLSM